MAQHAVCDLAAGCFSVATGDYNVTLRRVGEGLALASLDCMAPVPVACALESQGASSLFVAPRTGTDRYADWAAFEYGCRLTATGPTRVWRIAEDSDRVCLLGQSTDEVGARYPLAAALWCGWPQNSRTTGRGLFWQGSVQGHLWLVSPTDFPRHVGFRGEVSAESLLVALACHGDPRRLVLEVGGISRPFLAEISERFLGTIVPVEPFARLQVPPPLRQSLQDLEDPTMYLPALGAARALLQGPPEPLHPCVLSQAAAAEGG